MGLDQYIHRISIMPDEYVKIFQEVLSEQQYNKLYQENDNIVFYPLSSINDNLCFIDKKFIYKFKYNTQCFDINKAFKDKWPNEDPTDLMVINHRRRASDEFILKHPNQEKEYHLQVEEKYIYTDIAEELALYREEVGYWRKAYYLSNLMEQYTDFRHQDNNLVYLPLTKKNIQDIIQELTQYLIEGREDSSYNMDLYSIANTIKELRKISELDLANSCLCYYEWF